MSHPDGLPELRRDYGTGKLDMPAPGTDPLHMLGQWLTLALDTDEPEANAMTLTTMGPGGPSSRIVLLKELTGEGLVFFTNYQSRKGRDIAFDDRVASLFFWPRLERQVRVEGNAFKLDAGESDRYFRSRPADSRISAAASPQSSPVASREWLEQEVARLREAFPDGDVPRPEHWGGYIILPYRFEFWQGRPGRLHDRIRFNRVRTDTTNYSWNCERLAP